MLSEILGTLLAGLGLFFIGVKLVTEHVKQMTGRRFRMLVARFSGRRLLAGAWGFVSGALMQSTSAVTFIAISLVSARLITVRQAMPIVTWSNVGTSVLVLLAVLDVRLLALYLLAATGFCYYLNLDRSARFRHAVGSMLGIGLLFLGLHLMKSGAQPLGEVEWFGQLLDFTRNSFLLAFLVGAFLTFIAQSSSTVSIVAIALAKAGLLGVEQTMMIIYGTNFGTSLSTWLMASNLRGIARQLAYFLVAFKWIGVVILTGLFYIEHYFGIPLVGALVTHLSAEIDRQMALVYLVFQGTTALVVSMRLGPLQRLVERLSPATVEEELARPHFLHDQALAEPETALELVEKEQTRLANHLPRYLDSVREETRGASVTPRPLLHQATTTVLKQVDAFITGLLDQNHSRDSLEKMIRAQNRNELLLSLGETLDDLAARIETAVESPKLGVLALRLAEGLHVVLLTAVDAMETPDAENRRMLLDITADRGDLMERTRRSMIRGEQSLSIEEQQTLFAVTSLFERIVWLLRRLASLQAAAEES